MNICGLYERRSKSAWPLKLPVYLPIAQISEDPEDAGRKKQKFGQVVSENIVRYVLQMKFADTVTKRLLTIIAGT